jgi:NAD(P)-dependent dehydrogenase (short-subunit alcohol dehydrogenase family)
MASAEPRRIAFVTGASQGIGAAIALGLAHDGFDVAVSSRRLAKLTGVLDGLAAAGARSLPVELDLRSQPSIERAMAEVAGAFGRVDLLVNNGAVPMRKAALEVTPEEWETVVDTDLTGTFFMSQQMGRHLVKAGRPGAIISIASTHGLVGFDGRAVYGIAKAGVMHMTRMLAIEWAEHGIRVNAVAPGRVDTPSRAPTLSEPGYKEKALGRIPLQRFGTVDDVTAAVRYLAGPGGSYITGQTLVLDGGLTAW